MRNGTAEGLNANGGVSDRCVTVELLTGEHFLVSIEAKTTCSTIWSRTEEELVARGVVYPQIFGLAIKTAGLDWVFVDPDAKVSKYFPKEWKQAYPNNAGFIPDGKTLTLYCRVHFYLEELPNNFDVVSLHHYYLQLRQNLLSTPRHASKNFMQIVAYAFQAELGDWRSGQDGPKWAKELPCASQVAQAHQALAGMGQDAARLAFVRAAMGKSNMHLYAMTLRTKEGKEDLVWIGVTPKGIDVYQNTSGSFEVPEQPKITFLWANITKLYFERKKFEICGRASPWSGSTQKLSLTSVWESVPRHLLILCRSTHQFHLSNQKSLSASTTTANNESLATSAAAPTRGPPTATSTTSSSNNHMNSSANGNHAMPASSSAAQKSEENMLDLSLWADGLLFASNGPSSKHQRVSVISNASSNTTSGIVSDRVYSLDGSEEELDLREMPYSCAENEVTDNQTGCFAQAPPPPARNNTNSAAKPCCAEAEGTRGDAIVNDNAKVAVGTGADDEDEGKFWYCDSDCEDCEDAAAPCRSSLVRTIGEKRACAVQCDCNSCATTDELDDLDAAIPCTILHQPSPSMVSDATLKAVEIPDGLIGATDMVDADDQRTPLNQTPVPGQTTGCRENTGDIIRSPPPGWPKGVKDCAVKKFDKLKTQESSSDSVKSKCKQASQQPQHEDDDPAEHIYGEISENSGMTNDGEERLYFTIDSKCTAECKRTVPEAPPCASACCSKSKSHREQSVHRTHNSNKIESISNMKSCCSNCKCKSMSSQSTLSTSNSNPTVLGTKVNILTPKIASLKCLKPKGSFSAVTSSSCSWLPSRKLVRKKHGTKDKKSNSNNATMNSSSSQSLELNYPFHGSCIDFGEKLAQGRYPSTKTVSDNFDTDSDYVQLPPLAAQPKNPGLWKFVKSGKKTSECTKHCKQCAVVQSRNLPIPGGLNSLPRRHKFDHSLSISNKTEAQQLPFMRVTSKSTMALNTIMDEPRKPEPPPKPPKKNPTASPENKGRAVDARFIATKPQILVQTAYATPAPVSIPSKAEILCRRSKVPSSVGFQQANHHAPRSILKRPPATNLFHSHSVDNIYDAVASDEIPEPRPLTPSPPPCNHSDYLKNPMIVKPNNYIDVHASAHQSRKSCVHINDNKVTYAAPSEGSVSLNGKNSIFNRCGSVPNNLNNFFIGLQNLKPLSRSPIVHPAATSAASLSNNNNSSCNNLFPGERNDGVHGRRRSQCREAPPKPEEDNINARCATVYTSQLTQSQIQQFKAQLYSDMDYVIFPPKDPRQSQQEYYDCKSLSYSALPGGSAGIPYGISGIPPPYLPPPPPYAATTGAANARRPSNEPPMLPARPPKTTASRTNGSVSATSLSSCHKSYGSIYKPASTASQCSSQYTRGYYGPIGAGSLHLNEENIQRFLSTQSLTSSNMSSAPAVYYPCSTQSAPPLPPYNRTHGNNAEYSIIIENEMRKAVQNHLMNLPGSGTKLEDMKADEKLRLKLCRSEESVCVQPPKTVEEQLLAKHNLPPPPPYSRTQMSQNDLDLASLRAKCQAMELPLLRALCSEGALLTQTKPVPKVRPTAHAHPRPPAKKPLPPVPPTDCDKPPPLPQKPKITNK